jgi:hypothetical protein
VEKNDLVIQDVFNQFMEWFAAASQQGVLPKRQDGAEEAALG